MEITVQIGIRKVSNRWHEGTASTCAIIEKGDFMTLSRLIA